MHKYIDNNANAWYNTTMSNQNKKTESNLIPKTKEQKRIDLAFANLGLKPYNREDEPIDDSGETTIEKVTLDDLIAEQAIGKLVVDYEIEIPSEIISQTLRLVGDKPLEELTDTPPIDTKKQIKIDSNEQIAS
jgi:hypothetical protein